MRTLSVLLILTGGLAQAGFDSHLEAAKAPVKTLMQAENTSLDAIADPVPPPAAPQLRASVHMAAISVPGQSVTTSPAPEPGTLFMMGAAFLALAVAAKKFRKVVA